MPSLASVNFAFGIFVLCVCIAQRKKKAISHQLSLSVVYFNPDHHSTQCPTTALHWLQENVQEFGGDPTSVTLMGHGTGAACATFLMTSPAVLDGKSMKPNLCLTVPIYLELLSSVSY
jgi:hypothetical protein